MIEIFKKLYTLIFANIHFYITKINKGNYGCIYYLHERNDKTFTMWPILHTKRILGFYIPTKCKNIKYRMVIPLDMLTMYIGEYSAIPAYKCGTVLQSHYGGRAEIFEPWLGSYLIVGGSFIMCFIIIMVGFARLKGKL